MMCNKISIFLNPISLVYAQYSLAIGCWIYPSHQDELATNKFTEKQESALGSRDVCVSKYMYIV